MKKLKILALIFIALILAGASYSHVEYNNILSGNPNYPTKEIIRRSMVNDNPIVLSNIKQKIKNREPIKIAFMGGSITAGAIAVPVSEKFSTKLCADLSLTFGVPIEEINISWGSTSSCLGVFRFDEEVLPRNPDLLIVEYAVNDWEIYSMVAYENLIQKAIFRNIPIIALFTMTDKGWNKQAYEELICKNYNIPAISYRDAYYPLVENGTLKWNDIAADYVHPNNNGHRLIDYLLYDYIFKSIHLELPNRYQFSIPESVTERSDFLNTEVFQYGDSAAEVVDNNGFIRWCNPYYFKGNGFVSSAPDSSMEFRFTGTSLGISYHTESDPVYGKLEINIDDRYIRVIDGYNLIERCPSELIATDLEQCEHTAKIKMIQGSRFEIMAFLLGK